MTAAGNELPARIAQLARTGFAPCSRRPALQPDLRRLVLWLLAGTLFLPIAIALLLTVARLLAALEDPAASAALERMGLGLGIVWALAMIALLAALALQSLLRIDQQEDDGEAD
jgi:hypothetical protein